MQINNPVKVFVIFGVCFIAGLYISFFVAFQQISFNPYIVLGFGILVTYFGAKGIFKTLQYLKNKKE